jgi:hypothetical protein
MKGPTFFIYILIVWTKTDRRMDERTNKQTNKKTIQPMNGRTKELSFFLSIAIPTLPNLNWLIFELMSFFNNIRT